jgi:Protein of unknown function (DUF2971)
MVFRVLDRRQDCCDLEAKGRVPHMEDTEINAAYIRELENFIGTESLLKQAPKQLAHYTTIGNLEKIMEKEFWFSNPLFMNDLQELRLGLNQGMQIIASDPKVEEACATPERAQKLGQTLQHYFTEFDENHALDVYVFCLSAHDPSDYDGVLSMWRAYGGQGNGAALVFDTSFLTFQKDSPLILPKVRYKPEAERIKDLRTIIHKYLSLIVELSIPDDCLYIVSFQLFELLKAFALSYKHQGFREENEWRIILFAQRDRDELFKGCYHYYVGPRGVEPKLKFKIRPLAIPNSDQTWTFHDILANIILGPSVSSPLAKASIIRMLQAIGKPEFGKKVIASTIPLRPT